MCLHVCVCVCVCIHRCARTYVRAVYQRETLFVVCFYVLFVCVDTLILVCTVFRIVGILPCCNLTLEKSYIIEHKDGNYHIRYIA